MSSRGLIADQVKHPARRRHQALRVALRFLAGRDLDGQLRTDARWSKPGTQALTMTGRASRWAHYPHRRRSGLRVLTMGALLTSGLGWVVSPAATAQTLRVLAWVGIVVGGWAIVETSRRYVHRRMVVAPLAEVLSDRFKDARYTLNPRMWIYVPVDVHDRATRIYLPNTYTPKTETEERALVKLVGSKVGLVNPSYSFELQGETPYLELRPAPAPRDLVPFSDPEIRGIVERSPNGQPILGLGPRDVPYGLNLDADSPHIGFSMATGAGKSVAGRAGLSQNLHRGGIGMVLDRKIVSQAWADGLDSVYYARTCSEIHHALMWLSGEIDRRYQLIRKHSDINGHVDPDVIGPRLTVVVEELNTLEGDMRAWWREVRGPGDPLVCPSISVLGRCAAMGRQGLVHMLVISQKLTCQSIGGTAARENLSTRVLGRATTSTWNMLAPECKVGGKYPKSGKVVGRVHAVYAGEATPVQVIFMTPEEARDYALSGIVTVHPLNEAGRGPKPVDHRETAASEVPHPGETLAGEAGREAGDQHLHLVPDPDAPAESPDELVTLADAAERLALSVKTLRNARDRGQLPEPVESAPGKPSKYEWMELEQWDLLRRAGGEGSASA